MFKEERELALVLDGIRSAASLCQICSEVAVGRPWTVCEMGPSKPYAG